MPQLFCRTLVLSATLAVGAWSLPSSAHDRTPAVIHGDLKIEKIWARATSSSATSGAGYVMITNTGSKPDRLIGAISVVSETTEIHSTRNDVGGVKMLALEAGIEIPAGSRAVLRPGAGHPHVMFMELNGPIETGKPFKATLVFERAGKVNVKFRTVAIGASPAHAGH